MSIKPAHVALIPVFAIATLLAACKDQAPAQGGAGATPPAPLVGIITLEAKPYALTTELPGRTTAYRSAEVRPQVNGIIQKRMFEEGSEVKAGQQLYQIDASVYEATLKSAEATLASTRSLYQRYAELVKDNAVSQQAHDEARAAYLQAQANLEQARINVRYSKVLAPIDGRIGRSLASEGALVNSGQAQPLATIQQFDPIYIDVTQSSTELLRLRKAMADGVLQKAGENAAKVTLKLEDGSTYAHEGKLEFSEVSVDASTGTVTVRALFPNPDKLLLPGMFVKAQLVSGVLENAVLAPQQGVSRDPRGRPMAMVVGEDGKVEARVLQAERAVGNRWLVTSGLKAGDRLITEGLQYIQPGVQVQTKPASNLIADQQ